MKYELYQLFIIFMARVNMSVVRVRETTQFYIFIKLSCKKATNLTWRSLAKPHTQFQAGDAFFVKGR